MKYTKLSVLLIAIVFASFVVRRENMDKNNPEDILSKIEWKSPSVRMFFAIKKYSEKYDIPQDIAFSLAWHETRYSGPNHHEYEWRKVSSAGALGPMQIMPIAGKRYAPKRYSDSLMLNDIEYNVETSMRIFRYLKNRFGSWALAAGAYNTGQPLINDYARGVSKGLYSWR